MSDRKFRLVTRADFDGIVSAVLLRELNMIDEIVFAHPKDMQDGKVPVSANDITTNLPFVEGVHLCFDHHASEVLRVQDHPNRVINPQAASAARVVYDHFGGKARFPDLPQGLMEAVDQADSAQYSEEDILAPTDWTLLNFLLDPRTGLARFHDFTISNEQLMLDMVLYCRHHSIREILALPDVVERLRVYDEHKEEAEHQIVRNTTLHAKLAVIDLRREEVVYACNRFLIYALYPQTNISMQILPSPKRDHIEFAVGKSILDRSARLDIGSLMLEFGGGGHIAAGTCRSTPEQGDKTRDALIGRIVAAG